MWRGGVGGLWGGGKRAFSPPQVVRVIGFFAPFASTENQTPHQKKPTQKNQIRCGRGSGRLGRGGGVGPKNNNHLLRERKRVKTLSSFRGWVGFFGLGDPLPLWLSIIFEILRVFTADWGTPGRVEG